MTMLARAVLGQQGSVLPPAAFPTTDLFARYEAKDETGKSDADALGTIVDQFATYDLTQATGANQPTWRSSVLNGHAVYRFDGSDDVATYDFGIETDIFPSGGTLAVLSSSGASAATSRQWVFGCKDGGNNRFAAFSEGETTSGQMGMFLRTSTGTRSNLTTTGATLTDFHLFVLWWDEVNVELFMDGVSVGSGGRTGDMNPRLIQMGNMPTATAPWSGDIALAAIWDTPIDSSAIADLSSYCNGTYGVGA